MQNIMNRMFNIVGIWA